MNKYNTMNKLMIYLILFIVFTISVYAEGWISEDVYFNNFNSSDNINITKSYNYNFSSQGYKYSMSVPFFTCYQEDAHTQRTGDGFKSNSSFFKYYNDTLGFGYCNLNYSGTFYYGNISNTGYFYVNYTKPVSSAKTISQAKLQSTLNNHVNTTIPLSCVFYSDEKIMLRFGSWCNNLGNSLARNFGECYNGTDWINFLDTGLFSGKCGCYGGCESGNYANDGNYGTGSFYYNGWFHDSGMTNEYVGYIFEESIYWGYNPFPKNSVIYSHNLAPDIGYGSILINSNEEKTSGQEIKYYVSKDGVNYIEVQNNERYYFGAVYSKLFYKINLTTDNEYTSPRIINLTITLYPDFIPQNLPNITSVQAIPYVVTEGQQITLSANVTNEEKGLCKCRSGRSYI